MRFPRLWPRRGASPATSGLSQDTNDPLQPLQQAGQLLRERREERGLTMRDLSREIRITTPVLEALERGWSDRLPEAAYLGTMLERLERHLDLPPDSLHGALPETKLAHRKGQANANRRFTLGSIDIVSTWQGGVVYGVVMLGTLMALNQQQRYLAQRNSHQLEPIPPTAEDLQISNPQPAALAGIPGIRPLDDARREPLTQWLPKRPSSPSQSIDAAGGVNPSASPAIGLLQLNLSQPSAIRLSSAGGDRSELNGSQGQLTLQLQPPVSLTLQPPPLEEDQVLWNGQPQRATAGQPGRYRLPQASPLPPNPARASSTD